MFEKELIETPLNIWPLGSKDKTKFIFGVRAWDFFPTCIVKELSIRRYTFRIQ